MNHISNHNNNTSRIWILQPLLFVLALYSLFHQPSIVLNTIPNVGIWTNTQTLHQTVQNIPTELYSVWRLGQLSVNITDSSLRDASILAKWNFTDDLELSKMGELFRDYETNHSSLSAKIWGFMNFVNLIWLVSILGILVLIIPFLFVVLEPFAILLANIAFHIYEVVAQFKFLLEPFGYLICYLIVVQSYRYDKSFGLYIALTGIAGFIMMVLYSAAKHQIDRYKNVQLKRFCFFALIMIVTIPMAIQFNSRLFAFFAVSAFHAMVGFSVACYGLCYAIGFEDKDALERSVVASLITIPLFFWLNISLFNSPEHLMLQPFIQPVYIFTTIVYFLALLIVSSKYYTDSSQNDSYFSRQLLMITSLLVFAFVGSVYGIDSFFNIAVTFTILYLMEKFIVELMINNSIIVPLFLIFVAMYFSAMYLHTHPQFVVSLFTPKLTN